MSEQKPITYSQRLIMDYAKEHPDYFLCSRKDLNRLKERAEKEANEIMRDFFVFYSGDVKIEIGEKEHPMGWSVTGTLLVNGNKVRTEDPCTLLFIDINELVLKRMLELRRKIG